MSETISTIAKRVLENRSFEYLKEVGKDRQKRKLYETKRDIDHNDPQEREDWVCLDIQTANVITTVYEALKDEKNRRELESFSLIQVVNICWKMVK